MPVQKNGNQAVDNSVQFNIIGRVSSPYREKFAIPRQPGLASAAQGEILLSGAYNQPELVRDLAQFSHLWLLFLFHQTQAQGWQPLVRPPRLGGNIKTGVLATRSTFRPNPIGMSVVQLDEVCCDQQQVRLKISGLDLLHDTPIIDIKPYIPYCDALPDAKAGFAQTEPDTNLTVQFSDLARQQLAQYQQQYPQLALLIEQVLTQDPRPAYKQGKPDDKCYGMRLYDLNIQWQMNAVNGIEVQNIARWLAE